jgi:uncharacterized protein
VSELGTPEESSQLLNISADHAIARDCATVVAFVGRALRGPIDRAVTINSFTQYQSIFGGLWQYSPLSYAIEHFFEQGGAEAVVVRVANGGSAPTLSLPCGESTLTLQALTSGSHEFLRVAVDYDNLGNALEEHLDQFNMVVQRVREPRSERIEVQETFRRISINPSTQRYVTNVLLESKLVRVVGEVPNERPNASRSGYYFESNQDGSDGKPLSDYDIIGSAIENTGLFALHQIARLSFLYIPSLSRAAAVGMSTLLVAERFCRERQAILIVDPPAKWLTVDDALQGCVDFAFHSSHAVMYFPRVLAMDRAQGRMETFGNGAVVAGILTRISSHTPIWSMDSEEHELVPRAGIRLASSLTESERWRLAAHGINTLRASRNANSIVPLARTLAGGVHAAADFGYLRPQRLTCFVIGRIETSTQWARHGRSEPDTWRRITKQIARFLHELTVLGAFPAAHSANQAFMVACDERTHSAVDLAEQRINIVVAFAASRMGQYHCFTITQSPLGSLIKRTAINQLQLPFVMEPWLDGKGLNGHGLNEHGLNDHRSGDSSKQLQVAPALDSTSQLVSGNVG